jgi:dinuclear metal center YbgI/SA1388 family protein
MVTVKDILAWVDALAPFRYAAPWDNCGLQVGDPEAEVTRALVALEPSTQTLQEARKQQCQCVLTHHPLIFQPLTAVRADQFPGALVAIALRSGIQVIAAHTNLDVCRDGTNDQLARLLGLAGLSALEVEPRWSQEERYVGMGRLGTLAASVPLNQFVRQIQEALPGVNLRVVGKPEHPVQRVALCTGSGGSLLGTATACGCEVYVTGDLKYHEARNAEEARLALVDVGHFASERLVVAPLARALQEIAANSGVMLEVLPACNETDPFQSASAQPWLV